jgi:hypothetical protein
MIFWVTFIVLCLIWVLIARYTSIQIESCVILNCQIDTARWLHYYRELFLIPSSFDLNYHIAGNLSFVFLSFFSIFKAHWKILNLCAVEPYTKKKWEPDFYPLNCHSLRINNNPIWNNFLFRNVFLNKKQFSVSKAQWVTFTFLLDIGIEARC